MLYELIVCDLSSSKVPRSKLDLNVVDLMVALATEVVLLKQRNFAI